MMNRTTHSSSCAENALVSVVVPVFNTPSDELKRAMASILSQSYRHLDVILVDDGSCEACACECDRYASSDSRVRVIHQDNSGVSSARNAALDVSRGEWVMFVDPDDELLPGAVEEGVSLASDHKLDILYAALVDVWEGSSQRMTRSPWCGDSIRIVEDASRIQELARYFVAYESLDRKTISKGLSIGSVARLFRCSAIDRIRFDEDMTIMEDAIFNSEVVQRARRVGMSGKPWYVYHHHGGSATTSMDICSDSAHHCAAVRAYASRIGIDQDAYFSNACTYFFFGASSLARQGRLTWRVFRKGASLPWFQEAFSQLDWQSYDYGSASSRMKYSLACQERFFLLWLLFIANSWKKDCLGWLAKHDN